MRRLEPQAGAHALPPVSQLETTYEGRDGDSNAEPVSCWTVTERKMPHTGRARSLRKGGGKYTSANASPAKGSVTARGVAGECAVQALSVIESSPPPSKAERPKQNATQSRAIEAWLSNTLDEGGLSKYQIDSASLERLGLDSKATERVYRAMFVYSQGLHSVLQDAVGQSGSSAQALLVLWRAFTTVLESAAQSDKSGEDSLAALVQRGNQEELERVKADGQRMQRELEAQLQRVTGDRREAQQEVQRLREDERRLRNENEQYENDYEVAMSKYEREIRQRVEAEVRWLEKSSWCQALEEKLRKERQQNLHMTDQLAENQAAREAMTSELDDLNVRCKAHEAQIGHFRQQSLESAQQKQRFENQVQHLKQSYDRVVAKMNEVKEQLEQELEQNKQLTEAYGLAQRESRKLETQLEDESHFRQELQSERDSLRGRLEKLQKENSEEKDKRRVLQKDISDLRMKERTDQVELKRLRKQCDESKAMYDKKEEAYLALVDEHRTLTVETEHLREDVKNLDDQLRKETELRKSLQLDKKQLTGQLQTMQVERDTAQQAATSTRNELMEVTEKMVKLESIVRETKSAMQKVNLEAQVEQKAHSKKVAMLEKVIADERSERRSLVAETQEMIDKRNESLEVIKKKELECEELKRQRLEREEESDRYKILLKAQEQRSNELLVTVDKYHATVANHDAEMRQMQVLLECERDEAKRQIDELQSSYVAGRALMEQKVDAWQMRFEDALSLLHFNPATQKIQNLQVEIEALKKDLEGARREAAAHQSGADALRQQLEDLEALLTETKDELKALQEKHDKLEEHASALNLDYDRRSMRMYDAEQTEAVLARKMKAFDKERAFLQAEIENLKEEAERLTAALNPPKATKGVQAKALMRSGVAQTDLSYQYLEGSDNLKKDPRRNERLFAVKQAAHFIEDEHEGRDFSVQVQSSAHKTVEIQMLTLEQEAKGPIVHTAPTDRRATMVAPSAKQTAAVGVTERRGSSVPRSNMQRNTIALARGNTVVPEYERRASSQDANQLTDRSHQAGRSDARGSVTGLASAR